MEQLRDIDFKKYHTFFLEYIKDAHSWESHIVRPCTASYRKLTDKNRTEMFILDSAVLMFPGDTTLSEILVKCSLFGIIPDFVEIRVKSDDDRWNSSTHKVIQRIDTHKEDLSKYIEAINSPRFYTAKNKTKGVLEFFVVDRFAQDQKIKFLKGNYDENAIVAGFRNIKDAYRYCEKLNGEIK